MSVTVTELAGVRVIKTEHMAAEVAVHDVAGLVLALDALKARYARTMGRGRRDRISGEMAEVQILLHEAALARRPAPAAPDMEALIRVRVFLALAVEAGDAEAPEHLTTIDALLDAMEGR